VSLVVIGLTHRTVPLDLLERMTIGEARLGKALGDVASREHVREAVILSTCNRTEIYAVAEKFHGAYGDLRDFLSETAFLPPESFSDLLYVQHDEQAVEHLFCVAAGLDSAVLGEAEILGQVRRALDAAQQEGAAGPQLNLLFRRAVEVGKRARSETSISRHVASVSSAAVSMASERVGGLEGRGVCVLGVGEMGEGMAVALAGAGVDEVVVVNRTTEAAEALASRVNGRALPLASLPEALAEADVLLTSTGAASLMVEGADLAPVMERRGERPLLIVDVAVPRDVDPAVAELPNVTLLDMEDLRTFAEAGVEERRGEVAAVRSIVAEEVDRYLDVALAREVAPLITALRARAEALRTAELERIFAADEAMDVATRDAIDAASRRAMAKLLHEPTVRLKDAAGTPRGERLADALRELFEL
jgi:glutamyl-tRNA reductase